MLHRDLSTSFCAPERQTNEIQNLLPPSTRPKCRSFASIATPSYPLYPRRLLSSPNKKQPGLAQQLLATLSAQFSYSLVLLQETTKQEREIGVQLPSPFCNFRSRTAIKPQSASPRFSALLDHYALEHKSTRFYSLAPS